MVIIDMFISIFLFLFYFIFKSTSIYFYLFLPLFLSILLINVQSIWFTILIPSPLQVTYYSTRSTAKKVIIHGSISSNMGGSCKFKIHARMPLLHLSSCMLEICCFYISMFCIYTFSLMFSVCYIKSNNVIYSYSEVQIPLAFVKYFQPGVLNKLKFYKHFLSSVKSFPYSFKGTVKY